MDENMLRYVGTEPYVLENQTQDLLVAMYNNKPKYVLVATETTDAMFDDIKTMNTGKYQPESDRELVPTVVTPL